ncbi:HTH_Tnp_Tc3_2 domain-containing protein [Trichonephila clavipes]|uniref:HTH_Tnp_Tc3_2 domain-containing protein n=1 Tax=Trichonephila clavipes TaxID=2585209 RepID=A0A8X6SL63_TRICX|nr:HTH_Tnp_Tc3_2 domain-containing protein [Trichonephila clavipes]
MASLPSLPPTSLGSDQRPGSRRSRQTSREEDHHIIRNASVQPTASSAAIQAQVAPSLGAPVSSRTIRRGLTEALDAHPSTPSFGMVPRTTKLDCSGMEPDRL